MGRGLDFLHAVEQRFRRRGHSRGTNSSCRARRTLRCEPLEERQLLAITVEALTPTESGFVVEFSDQVETDSLNLYDAENGALGDADVTLEGAAVGAVPGSLVVDDNELTFVATDGPLAADTYTVTLRSASDGIVDAALGELLDGEYSGTLPSGDGTSGGDFVYSFSVEAPQQLVISLADIARGPTQAVQTPAEGSGEELPDGLLVHFSETEGITSGTLKVSYNPDLMTITAVQAGPDAPSSMLVEANLTESGEAVIAFSISGDPLESGTANLLEIIAEVPADATYGAVHVLDISEVEINAGAIEATADDAVHAVVFAGDANGNIAYDTEDARLIARVGMELDSGFAIDQPSSTLSGDYDVLFPNIDPMIIGDVTGNDSLSALDASDILRCVTGLETPNVLEIPDLVAPAATISPNGTNVSTDAIVFTIAFDEEVSGVDVGDLSVVGSLGSTLTLSAFTEVSTAEYTVQVTGMSRGENVTLTLTASGAGIEDATGNPLADDAAATVTYVKNTAPTAGDDSASADEDDSSVVIDVLDNDDDSDAADTLSVESVDSTSNKGATVTLNSDDTVTYNAASSDTLNALAEGETTTDTFQYSVTDDQDGTATGTVIVTVTGVNDTPTANADATSIETAEAIDIDVLANDTDPDTNDTLTIDSFDATSNQGATITLNTDGTLHYDPTASDTLTGQTEISDSFTYTLTDGHTDVAETATVTVTIGELDSSGTTYIVLNGDSITTNGGGATVDGTTVTITAARTYSISGTLNDGQVIVDSDDEEDVTLLLNGVDITCSDSAPIYVVSAANAVISLADGTDNYITDGNAYTYETTDTDEPDAAIFSHDDLKITGTGSLTVDANYNNGIASKDDLDILSGDITVTAVNHGIKGRDSVVVEAGTVTVNAGGDGIQSNNDEDAEKGYVTIEAGTLDITAGSDGIQAETTVLVNGGTIDISAGGGSTSGYTDTGKGIKATVGITIVSGTIDVDSADDAIHSDGSVTISGGNTALATADDAIHAESEVVITGGDIEITTCYEGIEAATITIDDSTIDLVSSNDGISAVSADGTSSTVSILGGTITIEAEADGIEAESQVLISGGTIMVSSGGGSSMSVGDTESAKGIKSDADLTIQGGTISVDSTDDALHANDTVTITGGSLTLASFDDGIHADSSITIDGGTIDITQSYDGIEGLDIAINDGDIHVVSSDDGINVSDGMGGAPGDESVVDGSLNIHGGYIVINAAGDGLDSNGNVEVTGGTIVIHGPTTDREGALDSNGTLLMSGGLLVAVGSSGRLAQTPDDSSTQEILVGNYGAVQAAGTMLHVETEDSQEIVTFEPIKSYQFFVISSPLLEAGTTYDVYSGGSSTGTVVDGLYSDGTYTPGTLLGNLTI